MNSNVCLFALINSAVNRGMTLHATSPDQFSFILFGGLITLEIVLHLDGGVIAELQRWEQTDTDHWNLKSATHFNMGGASQIHLTKVQDFDNIFLDYHNKVMLAADATNNPNSLVETNSELRDLVQIAPNEDQWLDGRGPIFQ